jgi:hypothetical protein
MKFVSIIMAATSLLVAAILLRGKICITKKMGVEGKMRVNPSNNHIEDIMQEL